MPKILTLQDHTFPGPLGPTSRASAHVYREEGEYLIFLQDFGGEGTSLTNALEWVLGEILEAIPLSLEEASQRAIIVHWDKTDRIPSRVELLRDPEPFYVTPIWGYRPRWRYLPPEELESLFGKFGVEEGLEYPPEREE